MIVEPPEQSSAEVASAVPNSLRRSNPESPRNQSRASSPAAKSLSKPKSSMKRKLEVNSVIPNLTFDDIGGCEETIKELFRCSRHLAVPQNYLQLGVAPPRGCLLHGPPGCGKTMMANALAGSLRVPMITVSGTELISGISGDSESKIRSLFDQAKSSSPCILFIDGIDVIAKKRENAQRDMELRIVSQLLSCLDDSNKSDSNQETAVVFVIGATDRLDSVDPALRTGQRLER